MATSTRKRARAKRRQRRDNANARADFDGAEQFGFEDSFGTYAGPKARRTFRAPGGSSSRRHRRREQDWHDEDEFAFPFGRRSRPRFRPSRFDNSAEFEDFPWEEFLRSEYGFNLLKMLTGLKLLQLRIRNSTPQWIYCARVLYELISDIGESVMSPEHSWSVRTVFAAVGFGLMAVAYPLMYGYSKRRIYSQMTLTSVVSCFVTTYTFVHSPLNSVMLSSPLRGALTTVGVIAVQLAAARSVDRRSSVGIDRGTVLTLSLVVSLGYFSVAFDTKDTSASLLSLFRLLLCLGGGVGFAKLALAAISPLGSYHRVTAVSGLQFTWQVAIVGVLCQTPYGCVVFHLVGRYVTAFFSHRWFESQSEWTLSGEPEYDLFHILAEVILHGLFLGVFSIPLVATVAVAMFTFAHRRNWIAALRQLSKGSFVGVATMVLALRIGTWLLHAVLNIFPYWLMFALRPTLTFMTVSALRTFLSDYLERLNL